MPELKVLLIDDDPDFRVLEKRFLQLVFERAKVGEYDPAVQGSLPRDFDWAAFDVLLLDYDFGTDQTGLDILRAFKGNPGFPATIMLTGAGSEAVAVRCFKDGANDYLVKKELTAERLSEAIVGALEKRTRERQIEARQGPLANVYDKALFFQRLEAATGAAAGARGSGLFLLRVENIEAIRDRYGTLALDEVVLHMLKTVGELEPGGDRIHVTRFGDGSLALLVRDVGGEAHLLRFAEQLHGRIGGRIPLFDGAAASVTLNIGVVPLLPGGPGGRSVLSAAEAACRTARQQKDSHVHLGQITREAPADAGAAGPDAGLDAFDLAKALEEHRVSLRFQPIVPTAESEAGDHLFDAIPRLVTVDGIEYTESRIRARAESQGDARVVDRWSLLEGLKRMQLDTAGTGEASGRKLLLRIGLASMADASLPEWLARLAQHLGLDAQGLPLLLEVAPRELISAQSEVVPLLRGLAESFGIGLCLSAPGERAELALCLASLPFRLVAFDVAQSAAAENGVPELWQAVRERRIGVLAREIHDAAAMTRAIHQGADYLQGDFLAPAGNGIYTETVFEVMELAAF